MSRLGFKSVVYHGDFCLGEVDVLPAKNQIFRFPNNEIRIDHISPPSERCPPLSILQTVSPFAVRCKLESKSTVEQPLLNLLHASCFHELKTAVVLLGDEEIHLVAMPSKHPRFWCCSVPLGLYVYCLGMLNLRCLAIVFDLDETLIVANTMKSFEDRIEALQHRIPFETDSIRVSGMSAELKRYLEDKALLKQYTENDYVLDNGKLLKVQPEEVPLLTNNHDQLIRPVIRLQERNIVLTRINPENRDTSVLVRLRPAWEDLRSYLTAKGRKRFEVYVCTMAERHYALEMWRLLDPEAHLISSKQLLDHVVCVKSGSRKALLNVFQNRFCHPKMAMVIDDRMQVWEDKDQPRVHVVPAFTPYYAPQAEMANEVPVLCVARNVACNVRGGFFREFDENLLPRISKLCYEDEVVNLPSAPDVCNYLMSEDAAFVPNGNRDAPISEGMSGVEVERRLNQLDQISGDPSFLSRSPTQISAPLIQPRGGLLVENTNVVQHIHRASYLAQESDAFQPNKLRAHENPLYQSAVGFIHTRIPSHGSQVKIEEAYLGLERQKQNHSPSNQSLFSGGEVSLNQASTNNIEIQAEAGKVSLLPPSISIGVLQEIGRRCSSKVEFRSVASTSRDMQFSVEVLFTGEKIGVGMGKTKEEAQQLAADNALHSLAGKYTTYIAPDSGAVDRDLDKLSLGNENGYLWEIVSPGLDELPREEASPYVNTSEMGIVDDIIYS